MAMVPAPRQAFELANQANLSPEEREDLEHRAIFIHDQRNAIKRALNPGHKEGREAGIEQGRWVERQQIARQMKAAGMDIAPITPITGLSVEDIEAL